MRLERLFRLKTFKMGKLQRLPFFNPALFLILEAFEPVTKQGDIFAHKAA